MAVLITGAGLVASHVARALQAAREKVVLYDVAPSEAYLKTVLDVEQAVILKGEITNLPELVSVANKHEVDAVIHTAGLIGAQVSNQPYQGVNVNLNGTIAAIEAARLAGVKRFVFCSSMAVYDFDKLPPHALITEDAPKGPKNLYAATKLAAEHLLDQYGAIYGIQVIHLRLAGVFGRGQYTGGSWMGRILNRALEASLNEHEVVVRREWLGTNEYVYVEDVAQAFERAVTQSRVTPGAYNIGTGVLHDAQQLLDEIRNILPNTRVRLAEEQTTTVSYLKRDQAFDISKAREGLGYEPKYTLREGLERYVNELGEYRGQYERLA